jgi:hypothetical protein
MLTLTDRALASAVVSVIPLTLVAKYLLAGNFLVGLAMAVVVVVVVLVLCLPRRWSFALMAVIMVLLFVTSLVVIITAPIETFVVRAG